MKKSLFAVAIFLFISSNQMLACDYYENRKTLKEIMETGTYKSNVSGKVCSDDKKSVIPIKDGKADGKVKVFLTDTDIRIIKVKFKNGIKKGLYKEYYPSGRLRVKVKFKDGKEEGLWKAYYESGALKVEVNYKNGELEGLLKGYYESGALDAEGNLKDDRREGLWKEYYESGVLKIEGNFKDGREEGLWKYYDESGKLKEEANYKNGERIN